MPEPRQQAVQPGRAPGAREQVARHADEVGTALLDPLHCALDCPCAARRNTKVEVREVRDAQTVELGGQPGQLDLELSQAHPTRLEPAVRDRHGRERRRAREDAGARQIWSFSRIGLTETTWRLNFSSD